MNVCSCLCMHVCRYTCPYMQIRPEVADVECLLYYSPRFFVCLFSDTVLVCSPGWPGTRHVDQAALKLSNVPTFVSQVLELKLCASTHDSRLF